MSSKTPTKPLKNAGVHAFRRGWPLVIQNGQVDDALAQSAHYISALFRHYEQQGKVPVQASIELTVIVKDK